MIIIDTNAWVEYLLGSGQGLKVKKIISSQDCLTIHCTVSELKSWSIRENKNFEELMNVVKANSHLVKIELEDWIAAAEIKQNMRKTNHDFGLVDALLLSVGKRINAKVVSGDPHFENIEGALFLRE